MSYESFLCERLFRWLPWMTLRRGPAHPDRISTGRTTIESTCAHKWCADKESRSLPRGLKERQGYDRHLVQAYGREVRARGGAGYANTPAEHTTTPPFYPLSIRWSLHGAAWSAWLGLRFRVSGP